MKITFLCVYFNLFSVYFIFDGNYFATFFDGQICDFIAILYFSLGSQKDALLLGLSKNFASGAFSSTLYLEERYDICVVIRLGILRYEAYVKARICMASS